MGKNNSENSEKEPNRKLVVQKRRVDIKPEISLTFNFFAKILETCGEFVAISASKGQKSKKEGVNDG